MLTHVKKPDHRVEAKIATIATTITNSIML